MSPVIYDKVYTFRVSSYSHVEFCPKRSKIESFTRLKIKDVSGAMRRGIHLHWQYTYPYKTFDRMLVWHKLGGEKRIFEKQTGNIRLRGKFDDLRVIIYKGKKYVSLIEIKTTAKKYLWRGELKSAIRQLQLYMWLLRDELKKIGFPLWRRSYLEVYNSKTGKLIRRYAIEYDENIERWIWFVFDVFKGAAKMQYPPKSYCKLCPKQVKERCDYYQFIKEEKI